MMEDDCCSVKRCRFEGQVKHLGKWLCDFHWNKLCEDQEAKLDHYINMEVSQ